MGDTAHPTVSSDAVEELVHFGLSLFLGLAIAFLDHAGELVLVALGLVKFVIGELALKDLGLALHLLPLSGDLVVVHHNSPVCRPCGWHSTHAGTTHERHNGSK